MIRVRVLTCVLLTMLAGPTRAAGPPPCADLPARVCQFYHDHRGERFIDGGNGTFTPNPMFEKPAAGDPTETATSLGETSFADEAVVADLMDIVDLPTLSTRAKLSLSMNAQELFSEGSEAVTLPWPLDAARPQVKVFNQAEAFTALRGALGSQRFDKFRALVTKTQNKISLENQKRKVESEGVAARLTRERYTMAFAAPEKVAKRQDEVRVLFREAKASVIAAVTNNRPRAQLNPEQLNLLTRLEVLEPRFLSVAEAAEQPTCQNFGRNAFHDREAHDVKICPAMLWEPDAPLIFVLGHEVGHPIDPCAVENDFARWNGPALGDLEKSKALVPVKVAKVATMIGSGNPYMSPTDVQYLDEPNTKKALLDAGVLKILAPRLDALPEIYRDAYACVAARYGYRTPSAQQREQISRETHQNMGDFGGLDPTSVAEGDQRLRKYMDTYRDCALMDGRARTQMNEAIADVTGAVAQEKYLRDHPPSSERDRVVSLYHGGAACDQSRAYKPDDLSPAELIIYQRQHAEAVDDDHAPSIKRLMMEADLPGTAAAVGCVRSESGCFDHLSLIKSGAATSGAAGARR